MAPFQKPIHRLYDNLKTDLKCDMRIDWMQVVQNVDRSWVVINMEMKPVMFCVAFTLKR